MKKVIGLCILGVLLSAAGFVGYRMTKRNVFAGHFSLDAGGEWSGNEQAFTDDRGSVLFMRVLLKHNTESAWLNVVWEPRLASTSAETFVSDALKKNASNTDGERMERLDSTNGHPGYAIWFENEGKAMSGRLTVVPVPHVPGGKAYVSCSWPVGEDARFLPLYERALKTITFIPGEREEVSK